MSSFCHLSKILQKNKPQLHEWNRLCVLEIKQAIHGFKTTSTNKKGDSI
jgi:hypothetical protein